MQTSVLCKGVTYWFQVIFVPAELLVGQNQSFESDGKAHVTAGHHVLDLKLQEASRKAEFLHHPGVFTGRQP